MLRCWDGRHVRASPNPTCFAPCQRRRVDSRCCSATLALPPQVAKAFVRLRNGLPAVTADRAAVYAAAASQTYHSFRGLPEEAWPLFLSSKQYLHMLDGGSQRLCRRKREVSTLASHGVSCTRSPARPMRIDPIPDALAGWR